jgi:hypothetical protein
VTAIPRIPLAGALAAYFEQQSVLGAAVHQNAAAALDDVGNGDELFVARSGVEGADGLGVPSWGEARQPPSRTERLRVVQGAMGTVSPLTATES